MHHHQMLKFLVIVALSLGLYACDNEPKDPPQPDPTAGVTPAPDATPKDTGTDEASTSSDPAKTSPPKGLETLAVKALAAQPDTTLETFSVEGMHCSACAGTVKEEIKKLEGINNIWVSVTEKKAWILVNDQKTDSAKIAKAIEEAGYKPKHLTSRAGDKAATPASPSESDNTSKQKSS